jgi:hypothetical protein
MKLKYRALPPQLVRARPQGLKFVHKDGKRYMVVEQLCCPRGHNLMAESVRIHGEPSIRLQVRVGRSAGLIYVDPFWGGHAKLYNFVPDLSGENPLIKASCPTCGTSLVVASACRYRNCRSRQAILLALPGGKNKIYVCAKLGCPGHRIELAGLPHDIADNLSEINYIGHQAENILLEI